MLSPIQWLLQNSTSKTQARRQVKRSGLAFVENLEDRQLLTTIMSEGFEGVFPNSNWVVNASQGRNWDDNNVIAHSGSWSGFGSESINNPGEAPLTYANNMLTTMSKTVDLTNYRDASLTWYQWSNTENNFDKLTVTVSVPGKTVTSTPLSGNHQSWTYTGLGLGDEFDGAASVTITFTFQSDASIVGGAGNRGVWVDDILLEGTLDEGLPMKSIDINGAHSNVFLNQFGNATVSGQTISNTGDQDSFRFGVDVGGSYVIKVTPTGALDSEFRLYDENGQSVSPGLVDGFIGGATESKTYTLTAGKFYTVVVAGFNTSTGGYGLDINGPSSTVTTLSTPAPVFTAVNNSNTINTNGDSDFFKVTAPPNATTLTMTVDPAATLDSRILVYDVSGTLLKTIDNGNTGDQDTGSMAVVPGTSYFLKIVASSINQTGAYTLKTDFDPDTPPQVATVKLHKNSNTKKIDAIHIVFDQTVDQTTVEQIAANYVLVGPNGPIQPGFVSAQWNPNTKTCVLTLDTPIKTNKLKNFKLQVLGTGTIHNAQNTFFDGNGDGIPGGDYQLQLNQASIV